MDIYKLKLTVSYQVFAKNIHSVTHIVISKLKKKKHFLLKKKRQGIGHCCREFGSPWPLVITKRRTFHGSICVPKLIHVGPKNSFLGSLGRPLALGMLHFYLIFFVGFIPILCTYTIIYDLYSFFLQ